MFDRQEVVSRQLLKKMADSIAHRGPDDEGFYTDGQIGLGFRRLSIIDLSGGHQPLSNENGTVWIVFNGEIYNYESLREGLLNRGHQFKTRSDTEVIVHLYEEYGTECVSYLRGMFAFAIWDSTCKLLLLARDRIGIKPLYYHSDESSLVFGSELKAILADPLIERRVNLESIDCFLTYYFVPGDRTLLEGISKLEPGHILIAREGNIQTRRYWDLEFEEDDARNDASTAEELLEKLEETVRLHMVSDVPVGFLLSGGVDSTAMLSLAADKAEFPVSTFTVGFGDDEVVDERPFARLAAGRYKADHYELTISPKQFADFLPAYAWHMEEPLCQPPAVALYYISQLASQHVKVLISGEGGDEAFAGYENYRNTFWFERLRTKAGPVQPLIGRYMTRLGSVVGSRLLTKYGNRLGMKFEDYYLSRTSTPFEYFPSNRSDLYSDSMRLATKECYTTHSTREYIERASNYGLLNKMLYVDTKTWLPDVLLTKADKMTMANGVELRVPLLDHKLLEFAARLPRKQKIRGWTMKYALRKALAGRVPKPILQRKKAGFPVPYHGWLRGPLSDWAKQILLDDSAFSRSYFKDGVIEGLIRRDLAGMDFGREIFSLLALELWHHQFIGPSVSAQMPVCV